ncbi:MAG: response regulator transcription factor [Chloroflexi bacterium OHK40]
MDHGRILLVEDEPITRVMLEARLRAAGHRVVAVDSGEAALAQLDAGSIDLLITDLHLGMLDGVALMAHARDLDPELPLIVLTGVATLDSAIAAVEHGASAYIRKPVAPGALESRVTAVLARRQRQQEQSATLRRLGSALLQLAEPPRPGYTGASPVPPIIRMGMLQVDPRSRQASLSGQALTLSQGEFMLLLYLAERGNEVVSAERIALDVLNYHCSADEARELVKARVHRLRQKLEPDPRSPRFLISVRGAGYMLTGGE